MSNLNNNTTQLELLLQKVNNLPAAGSSGTDTSDATATADEIFAGETSYGPDGKITGTFTIEDELTEQNDLISQIQTLIQTKTAPSGGTDTSDANATASDMLNGKTAYVNGVKITGNIPSKTAATYTPTTTDQTIASGQYLSGTQTIKGDANLKASNIKSGTSIFGVTGSYVGNEGVTPVGTINIATNGTYDVTNYASAIVNVTGSGSGTSIETVGSSPLLQSTAEGSVIYAYNGPSGITTYSASLNYLTQTKKYRAFLDSATLLNTPIVVLTSGTVTFSVSGYTTTQIASGTGYIVYKIEVAGDPEEEPLPEF